MITRLRESVQFKIYFYVILLVAIYSASYDMYVASFPLLQAHFQANTGHIQFSLTIFVLASVITGIPVGILSDLYGRKKCLIGLIILAFIGTWMCVFSINLYEFYVGRGLQGIGGAGIFVVAISIPRDLLKGEAFLKVWQWLTLIFYIAPSIASAIGGYLAFHFNWQSTFWVILILALFALGVILFTFKETSSPIKNTDDGSSKTKIIQNYKRVGLDPKFLTYCYITAVTWAGMALYYVITPFIVMSQLGHTAVFFGWMMFSMVVSGVVGRALQIILFRRFLSLEALTVVFSILNVLSVLSIFLIFLLPGNAVIFILVFSSLAFGFTSSISAVAGSSLALKSFDKSLSATAATLYGLMIDLIIFLVLVISPVLPASALTLAIVLTGLTSLGLLFLWIIYTICPAHQPDAQAH